MFRLFDMNGVVSIPGHKAALQDIYWKHRVSSQKHQVQFHRKVFRQIYWTARDTQFRLVMSYRHDIRWSHDTIGIVIYCFRSK